MNSPTAREAGVTLLEVIVVVVIFGIVASMAVPGFQVFIAGSKISATTNSFVSTLYAARSEAITRGQNSGVCPSNNSAAANAQCSTGAQWTDGWIAFVDDNSNGVRDLGTPSEDLIVRSEPLSAAFVVTNDIAFANRVYFSNSGTSTTTAGIPISGTVTIRYGSDEAREVRVAANGRVSTRVLP